MKPQLKVVEHNRRVYVYVTLRNGKVLLFGRYSNEAHARSRTGTLALVIDEAYNAGLRATKREAQ